MTTNVRIKLESNPHDVEVHVITVDKNTSGADKVDLQTKLCSVDDDCVLAVWDNRSIRLEEHPLPKAAA